MSKNLLCAGLMALAALIACSKSPDDGTGNTVPMAGVGVAAAGGSTPPTGAGAGGTTPPTGAGASGTTPVVTSGTGAPPPTSGAGGSTPDPMAGNGGGSGTGDPPGGNTGFAIPATCGAATPNATVGNTCPGSPPPAIKLTEIASGLVGPTYVAQAPGDATRLYVLEQLGPVRVIENGMLKPDPLMDLRDISGAAIDGREIVGGYSENGLLGMVFHKQFEMNRKFYLSYTKMGLRFAIAEFTMNADFTVDVTTYRELGTFPQYSFFGIGDGATNHVGSMLAWGPDGCLYVSRGEGGGEDDVRSTGQNTSDTESSILRIDVDNWNTAPAGNLAGLVWSFGFRNPWRFSFDRVTGDMYIGDVGQNANSGFEEVNVEPRGASGRNYGWGGGPTAGPDQQCSDPNGCIKPAVAYLITNTENSVIGGYVYRGSAIPGLVGRYVWADWTEREIKTFVWQGEGANREPMVCDEHSTGVVAGNKVRSFGEGIDGELYVVTAGAPTGGLTSASPTESGFVYRIDPM